MSHAREWKTQTERIALTEEGLSRIECPFSRAALMDISFLRCRCGSNLQRRTRTE